MSVLSHANVMKDVRAYLRNKENHDFYVINTSDLGNTQKRSELAFKVQADGDSKDFLIPDTFIPINIGLQVSDISVFGRSESLDRFMKLDYLKAIDTGVAEKYLETAEAKDEVRRLYGIAPASDNNTGGVTVAKSMKKEAASPMVVSIILNATMAEPQKVSALRNIQGQITRDDIEYVIKNAKDMPRVKEFVQSLNR